MPQKKMKVEDAEGIETAQAARDFAIDWQHWMSQRSMSWGEVSDWQGCFEKLGAKFDLTEEFEENGIL